MKPKQLRFNRTRFGLTATSPVKPKQLRFNRSHFRQTEATTVKPKLRRARNRWIPRETTKTWDTGSLGKQNLRNCCRIGSRTSSARWRSSERS